MKSTVNTLRARATSNPYAVSCAIVAVVALGAIPLGAWLSKVAGGIVIFGMPLGPALLAAIAIAALLTLASRAAG